MRVHIIRGFQLIKSFDYFFLSPLLFCEKLQKRNLSKKRETNRIGKKEKKRGKHRQKYESVGKRGIKKRERNCEKLKESNSKRKKENKKMGKKGGN